MINDGEKLNQKRKINTTILNKLSTFNVIKIVQDENFLSQNNKIKQGSDKKYNQASESLFHDEVR
jgi:hypothetical protein